MSGAELARHCEVSFGRHETFHPRYGWLRKAYVAADADREAFNRPEATVNLGVGKNMVHSIRYWGWAFKLLEDAPGGGRSPGQVPTDFADRLFNDDGWDPYLEDPGSLWLLHWRLLARPCRVPAWWTAFHALAIHKCDDATLVQLVMDLIEGAPGWPTVARSSIKKDIDCLLRTYSVRTAVRDGLDDLLDCPFRELGLLEPVEGHLRTHRFVSGPKYTLPPLIAASTVCEYLATEAVGTTVEVAVLANEPGGPGQAFRLPTLALGDVLSAAAVVEPRLRVTSVAGSLQLIVDADPVVLSEELIEQHYRDPACSMAITAPPEFSVAR